MKVTKHMQSVWVAPLLIVLVSVGINFAIERYFDHVESVREQRHYAQRQLQEFYLPMQHLLQASSTQWLEYKRRYGERLAFEKIEEGHMSDETRQWQLYMLSTFQPLHTKLEMLVIDRGGLAEEDAELKSQFQQLLDHISAYRTIFARWKVDDHSEQFAFVMFPGRLEPIIAQHIEKLRKRLKKSDQMLSSM